MAEIPTRRIRFVNMAKDEYELDVSLLEKIVSVKKSLIDILPEPYHISRLRFWIPGDILKMTEPFHLMNQHTIQYYTDYISEHSSVSNYTLDTIHFFYIQLPDVYEQTTYISPYLIWDAIDKQDMSLVGLQVGQPYTFRMFGPTHRSNKIHFDFFDSEGVYHNCLSTYQQERNIKDSDILYHIHSSRTWGGQAPAGQLKRQWHSDVITLEYQLPSQHHFNVSLQSMDDFVKGTFIGFQDIAKIQTLTNTGHQYFGRIKLQGPFETFSHKGDNTTSDTISSIPKNAILFIDFWYISPPDKKELLGHDIDSSALLDYFLNR